MTARKRNVDGAPHGDGKAEQHAASKRWRVIRDGKLLAGSSSEAEAKRLAAYLGAEVEGR